MHDGTGRLGFGCRQADQGGPSEAPGYADRAIISARMKTFGRTFPFAPKSSRDLRIGDYWVVMLANGTLACLQVTDLKATGVGALKTLVAGVLDWRGSSLPEPASIRGARVLTQGLTRIEAFTDLRNSQILGNCT